MPKLNGVMVGSGATGLIVMYDMLPEMEIIIPQQRLVSKDWIFLLHFS